MPEGSASGRMVVAAVYAAHRNAEAARDLLEREGFRAFVEVDDAATDAKLLVPGSKVERARRALGEARLIPASNAALPEEEEDASLPVMGLIFVAIAVVTAAVFIVLFLSALF